MNAWELRNYINNLIDVNVLCYKIKWDTDGYTLKRCGLKTRAVVNMNLDGDLVALDENGNYYIPEENMDEFLNLVSDALSDQYGFCHYGFSVIGIVYFGKTKCSCESFNRRLMSRKNIGDQKWMEENFKIKFC